MTVERGLRGAGPAPHHAYERPRQGALAAPWVIGREVSKVFEASSLAEAKKLEALRVVLGGRVPEVMSCFVDGFLGATTFYVFHPRALAPASSGRRY